MSESNCPPIRVGKMDMTDQFTRGANGAAETGFLDVHVE